MARQGKHGGSISGCLIRIIHHGVIVKKQRAVARLALNTQGVIGDQKLPQAVRSVQKNVAIDEIGPISRDGINNPDAARRLGQPQREARAVVDNLVVAHHRAGRTVTNLITDRARPHRADEIKLKRDAFGLGVEIVRIVVAGIPIVVNPVVLN